MDASFPFWTKDKATVLQFFKTSENGLTEIDAAKRIKTFGKNELAQKSKWNIFFIFINSFLSPLTLLLVAAGFLSALVGAGKDFIIILIILVVSGVISFLQHVKAENATKRLQKNVVLTATVLRDNEKKEVPFSNVTVGDIVFLSAGDIVPAEGRLLETKDIFIDESSLTGESVPVEKNASISTDTTNKQCV
ncbi:MAG: HAD-IC family P-type ATPase, partial [Candidatus Levyibacteriota bacterium]